MLDEFIIGGEVQETSKKNVLKAIAAQDLLQEVRYSYIVWMISLTAFMTDVFTQLKLDIQPLWFQNYFLNLKGVFHFEEHGYSSMLE